MLILHAAYTSNNPELGLVEFQLKSFPKEGQIATYLATTNKIPSEEEFTASELQKILNNGYKWEITAIEPIVQEPSEEELLQELFELLVLLSEINKLPGEKPQLLLNECNCPYCLEKKAED